MLGEALGKLTRSSQPPTCACETDSVHYELCVAKINVVLFCCEVLISTKIMKVIEGGLSVEVCASSCSPTLYNWQ